ncbi:MAG: Flp pilus assembly protein CpaB [Pseudomonas sp.]|nr:Flp pilus assembly protein CpaB [Pseudomonas sp.]
MGKTQKILGILLILAALGLAAYAWVLSKEMTSPKPAPMQRVVVAAQRIEAGSLLTADKLQLMDFPTRPAGSYGSVEGIVGKVAPVDFAAGEPLLAERIEGSATPSLRHLEAGERAVAIKVDEVIAVGNRLAPGDRVDVFATFRRNSEEVSDSQARLLLAGLRVLAFGGVAPDAKKTAGGRTVAETPRTAVLAVPLADVDKLALAAEAGRLLLALRPAETVMQTASATADDPATPAALPSAQTQTVSLRELTGGNATSKAAPAGTSAKASAAAAPGPTVKVLHGLKEQTVPVGLKRNGAVQ